MLAVLPTPSVEAPITMSVATAQAASPCAPPVTAGDTAPATHPPTKAAMMPEIAQYRKAPQLTPTGLVATVDVSTERRPIPRPSITNKTCTIRAATTPARTEVQLKVDLSKNTLRRVAIAMVASLAAALTYVSTPKTARRPLESVRRLAVPTHGPTV